MNFYLFIIALLINGPWALAGVDNGSPPQPVVLTEAEKDSAALKACNGLASTLATICEEKAQAYTTISNADYGGIPDSISEQAKNNAQQACSYACNTEKEHIKKRLFTCDDAINNPQRAAISDTASIIMKLPIENMNNSMKLCENKNKDIIVKQKIEADKYLGADNPGYAHPDEVYFDYNDRGRNGDARCKTILGGTSGNIQCMSLGGNPFTITREQMRDTRYMPVMELARDESILRPRPRPPLERENVVPPCIGAACEPRTEPIAPIVERDQPAPPVIEDKSKSDTAKKEVAQKPSTNGGSNGGTGSGTGTNGGGANPFSSTPFNLQSSNVSISGDVNGGPSEVTSLGLNNYGSELTGGQNSNRANYNNGSEFESGGGRRTSSTGNSPSSNNVTANSQYIAPAGIQAASMGSTGNRPEQAGYSTGKDQQGNTVTLLPGSRFYKPGGAITLNARKKTAKKIKKSKTAKVPNNRIRDCQGNVQCLLAVANMSDKAYQAFRAKLGSRTVASYFDRSGKSRLPSDVGTGMHDVIAAAMSMVTNRYQLDEKGFLEEINSSPEP